MPPGATRRLMRSGAIQLGAVSVLSLTLAACSSPTTAYCVDRQSTSMINAFRVVPDRYCEGTGSYGRYYWYYGGRYRSGYVSRGSTIKPHRGKVSSKSGKVLQRGGFGGHSSHSSRGG